MKSFTLRLLISLAFACATSHCAYRFGASGAPMPEQAQDIYAPVLLNKTAEPGLEAVFTEALRSQLIRLGYKGSPTSEAQVVGELVSIWSGPTLWGVSSGGGLASYRTTIGATLRLERNGRVLSETFVTGSEDFLPGPGGDILQLEANRQVAMRRLANTLMRDGFERLATGW